MKLPNGRSFLYIIWRSCERFKILPPGIRVNFNDNESWNMALLIAYEQVRAIEGSFDV